MIDRKSAVMGEGDSSMREAAVVAILTSPPSPSGEEIAALPASVRWLEVRADRAGELEADWLRDRFPGELLYSLRGGGVERRERLLAAAERWDLVDLEAGDLDAGMLARLPAERRVLSWHGPAAGLEELRARWQELSSVPARLVRLVPAAVEATDALAPLRLLREAGRADLTAFASGAAGWWSRLLAPRLGAPYVFAAVGEEGGEPTVDRLLADYGLPALPPVEELYGILGPAPTRSLSPRLHNAAYRSLGLPALYVPFPAQSFGAFWGELANGALADLGFPLRGLTVNAPFKEPALAAATEATALARQAGAANTLLRAGSSWRADTADADGVLVVLESCGIEVAGCAAAVVGCGGAGRAAALGLQRAGARVTLVNRGAERGCFASRLLGLPLVPLAGFDPRPFSLVVHATPVVEELPFPVSGLEAGTTVVELVYGPASTPLMAAAAARGCTAIDGREVLLVEARRQFQMMTGRSMPAEPARAAIAG
jgi:3-dehydroquinate dehydratase / shikimate dehydrogenase